MWSLHPRRLSRRQTHAEDSRPAEPSYPPVCSVTATEERGIQGAIDMGFEAAIMVHYCANTGFMTTTRWRVQ